MKHQSTRCGLIALVYALPSSRRPRFRERTGRGLRMPGLLAVAAVAIAGLIGSAQALAQNAYITNTPANTVSVVDTSTNTVIATIPVGNTPYAVAVRPDGSRAYIGNQNDNTVSAIDTSTNTVIATIPVGSA